MLVRGFAIRGGDYEFAHRKFTPSLGIHTLANPGYKNTLANPGYKNTLANSGFCLFQKKNNIFLNMYHFWVTRVIHSGYEDISILSS